MRAANNYAVQDADGFESLAERILPHHNSAEKSLLKCVATVVETKKVVAAMLMTMMMMMMPMVVMKRVVVIADFHNRMDAKLKNLKITVNRHKSRLVNGWRVIRCSVLRRWLWWMRWAVVSVGRYRWTWIWPVDDLLGEKGRMVSTMR